MYISYMCVLFGMYLPKTILLTNETMWVCFCSDIHLIYRRKKPYARKRPSHMLEPTKLDLKQCRLTVS